MTGTKLDPQDIKDLIPLIENGSGRDVDLDRQLEALWWPKDTPQWESNAALPAYTTSLDAVAALQERLLPFCMFTVRRLGYDVPSGKTSLCEATIKAGGLRSEIVVRAGSYARALLAATLRAVLATMEE